MAARAAALGWGRVPLPSNPAWRYLPSVETAQTERSALIERANSMGSALRILNDELGCGIPEESGSKSWKFRCPYGDEHADGGVDKNCRFYWESDRAYCFADHGVLDFVGLRSLMWGVSMFAAARRIVQSQEALEARKPWWERVPDIRARMRTVEQPKPMSTDHAKAALYTALRAVPGYIESQYRPEIREAVAASLEALDPSWTFDLTLQWLDQTVALVQSRLVAANG